MISIAHLQGIWDLWCFAGVAVLVAPHIPLNVGVESRRQFCLQTTPSLAQLPLQYTVCVGENVKAVYQESIQQLSTYYRELPSMNVLRYGFFTNIHFLDALQAPKLILHSPSCIVKDAFLETSSKCGLRLKD